tara:strand:- start:761 stop:1159 length:399 start_codon:yes stop_codon:yes gene_type:complete
LPVAIEILSFCHQHARGHVQQVALYGGRGAVAVHDVDLQTTQEVRHLAVQAPDHAIHHRGHCLVGTALVVRRVDIHADAPLPRDRLLCRVGVEHLSGPPVQVDEVDLSVVSGDRDVVEFVPAIKRSICGQYK